ncbi:endochitinase [Anabrus simplex]|uniref:endochitinase n=1 Tax=Anabrus simplex TaxID=316456 RepID=UPI0034DD5D70
MTGKGFLLFVLGLLAAILDLTECHAGERGRVVCYYNPGGQYRPDGFGYSIDNIPGNLCTHAVYTFIGIDVNKWEVKVVQSDDPPKFRQFVSLKERYPDLRTQIAIGGWSEGGKSFSDMVSNPNRRASMIRSIVGFMNQYGFDGFDLDWETPGDASRDGVPADKANFLAFVIELREAFNKQPRYWEITMAVPTASKAVDDGFAVPQLCEQMDAIHVMSYDMRDTWVGYADTHSPLYRRSFDEASGYAKDNVNDALQGWKDKGCPADRLVVGVPFYGHSFTLRDANQHGLQAPITGKGSPGPVTKTPGILAYYEICRDIQQEGWIRQQDTEGRVPYAYKGNQWVGYDDPTSLTTKMNFIKQKGYGGAMVWSIDMDDFVGVCGSRNALLNILNSQMSSYIVPKPARKG